MHQLFLLRKLTSRMISRISKTELREIDFYFLLPVSRESIVFGSNFRSGDFDGFTRFEVP